MILNLIRVEGWRCFAGSTVVGPFTEGLNIICGPNGSGKSTLMTALVRALFDSHLVMGEDINTLRPWGRDLNPRVTLEFTHEGSRYRLVKQFLAAQTAELCRLEGDQYVPLAESRAADEHARRLLAGEAPGRGVTDQRHWGLAQVLWATQGNLPIATLSSATQTTLQEALGAQIAGPTADALEKRVAELHSQYFTRAGKLKAGASAPAVVRLQAELESLEQRREQLLQRWDDFEAASRRIEDLRSKAAASGRDETELAGQLLRARELAQVYKDLLQQQTLHRQEVASAEERYRNLADRIQSIASCRTQIEATNQQLERLREDAPAQAQLVDQCRQHAQEAKQAVLCVRMRRGEVKEARQLAQAAARYAAANQQLAELTRQIEEIERVQQELAQLRAARRAIQAPDAKTLAKIKKTARTRDDARLQLEAALITVTLEPDAVLPIQITLGEEPGLKTLAPGQVYSIQGDPTVAFRIEGVGSFRASGPTGSVDELRGKCEKATAAFQELITGFGTDDLEELERRQEQAAELDGRIERADVKSTTLLAGRQLDAILADRDQTVSGLKEMLAAHHDWATAPPDPEQWARQADAVEQQFTDAIDRAEAESEAAQESLNRAADKQAAHQGEIKNAERRQKDLQAQLESLCGDGLDHPQRDAQLTDLAMQRDAARGKLKMAEARLAEHGDDPLKSVAVLEKQLVAIRAEKEEAEKSLHTERGRLEQITSDAPYSALATA